MYICVAYVGMYVRLCSLRNVCTMCTKPMYVCRIRRPTCK